MKGVSALFSPAKATTYGRFVSGPELRFSVPLIPPSVNHYKRPNGRGGWFITKEAQAFTEAVCMIGRTAAPVLPIAGKFYAVTLTVWVNEKKFLRADSDNMEKVAFDALTKAGIIRDDRYITRHQHNRFPVATAAEERTEYTVCGREEP